nr:transcription activator GLK2-like isoform X3 [Ipomoea trifida]
MKTMESFRVEVFWINLQKNSKAMLSEKWKSERCGNWNIAWKTIASATPKAIMDLMKEKDLTLSQVAGHLQMYRSFCFAQQQATRGNGGYGWSAPIHYQQAWPQPSPPRLYIDPVGPMPPSIPPMMRMMDFSTTEQETILFEGVFQECRKRPIVGVEDEVDDENVRLELMLGDSATKKPKIDLTLTLEPPVNEGHDSSRPNV